MTTKTSQNNPCYFGSGDWIAKNYCVVHEKLNCKENKNAKPLTRSECIAVVEELKKDIFNHGTGGRADDHRLQDGRILTNVCLDDEYASWEAYEYTFTMNGWDYELLYWLHDYRYGRFTRRQIGAKPRKRTRTKKVKKQYTQYIRRLAKIQIDYSPSVREQDEQPFAKAIEDAVTIFRPMFKGSYIKFQFKAMKNYGLASFVSPKNFRIALKADVHIDKTRSTIIHELAHIVEYLRHDKWSHGKNFQKIFANMIVKWNKVYPDKTIHELGTCWRYDVNVQKIVNSKMGGK